MSDDIFLISKAEIENLNNKDKIISLSRSYIEPLNTIELAKKVIIPRKILLSPWLKEYQLAMIYAEPGIGKTFFALNCAHALISGKDFLKFKAETVPSVLYIDSEMDEEELQERWRTTSKGINYEGLKFYTPSLFEDKTLPEITTYSGQKFYDIAIEKYKPSVIFLDSLSFLTDIEENNAKEWNFVIKWLIRLKNKGHSVVCIHHTNKGKLEYRGSTKLGGIMNSIIFLEKINDDEEDERGARFTVKYKKKRSFKGKEGKSFEAWLDVNDLWHTDDPVLNNRVKVMGAYKQGMKPAEMAKEFRISLATVYNYIDEAITSGLIKKKTHGNKKPYCSE